MKARLIAVSVPSSNLGGTRSFFEALLGFAPVRALSKDVESYHIGIADGVYLWLNPPHWEEDKAPVAYFAVDNLEEAVHLADEAGGQLTQGTMAVQISEEFLPAYEASLRELGVTEPISDTWGRVQMVRDPSNILVALCEVEPHSQIFFGIGNYSNARATASMLADLRRSERLAQEFF